MKNPLPLLRVEPRRSRWLAGLLLLAHTGALVLVILVPLSVWVKLIIVACISMSLMISLRRYALLKGRRAIVSALWDSDNQWILRNALGAEFEASLLPSSYVNTGLVILNFSAGSRWRFYSMVLLPDSLDADTLRRLRVRLLHPPVRGSQNSAASE